VGLSPQGAVKGPLVHIPNLGCEAVSLTMPHDMAGELTRHSQADFPEDLTGKIILVFRGTCQSAVKVALAGARGATGALIYNNADGNLDGYSLQRLSTPEGPYVPTGGISQADGLALIEKLDAGIEVIADLSTEMSVKTT
jgi:aminopeptidase Y